MTYGVVTDQDVLVSCDRCGAAVPQRMGNHHQDWCITVSRLMGGQTDAQRRICPQCGRTWYGSHACFRTVPADA